MAHSVTAPVPAAGGVHVADTVVCAGLDTCVMEPEQPVMVLEPASTGAKAPARGVLELEPKADGEPSSGANR